MYRGVGAWGASILERVVHEGLTEKLTRDLTAEWGSRPGEEGCQEGKQPGTSMPEKQERREVGDSRPWGTQRSRECSGHTWTPCL